LRGFESIYLKKNQVKCITFYLTRYDLSIWDNGKWTIPDGRFGITVGASSRDKRLQGLLQL
jgi:beta-glucosidase